MPVRRRRARLKPEDILWPVEERTIEAINHNFDLLFHDLALFDDVLPVIYGGTGTDTFVAGDVVVAVTPTQLGGLEAVALNQALISQGVGVVPAWGKIGLTTHVTGILPIANGGTNAATKTAAFNNLSPLTTKGDLLAFDGNNVRRGVGTDGQFLVADSGQADGLNWRTLTGVTHNLLAALPHTDTETATVVRGALIVGASLPFNGQFFWEDGGTMLEIDSGADYSAQQYWGDGAADGALGFTDPNLIRWRRLSPAAGTLRSNGIDTFWGGDTVTQPRVRAYRITSQSIATGAGSYGSGTQVTFEASSFDSHSFWSASVNPTRLTVPTGQSGIYLVIGQASWNTSATARKAAWLFKNGARFAIAEVNGDDGGLGLSFTVSAFVSLAVGDYVELVVRQDTAGALALLGDATGQYAQLQMVRIAL